MTSPIQPVKIPASDVVVGDVVVGHTLAGETVQEPVVHISHGFTRVTTMDAITDSPVIRLHFGRVGGEVIQFAPDALVPVLR